MQPIQSAIESLHKKGLCPRLHVDVTHADAVCPEFVVDKWKERLVIDLDPSYPLELSFTKIGVEANLSFGGYVTRCVFPWAAIYVVADRSTGRGQVFATNIPASLRHEFGPPPTPDLDPTLTAVRDDQAKKGSRRRKRRGGEPEPAKPAPLSAVSVIEGGGEASADDEAQAEADAEADAEAETELTTDTEPEVEAPRTAVQARRAAFKVIDGGS